MKKIATLFFIALISTSLFSQDYENYTYKLEQSTSSIEIWTTTPANKVLKTAAVPQEIDNSIKVYCAKNEFEPFVFIIKPTSNTPINITLQNFGEGIETQINQVKYVYLEEATDGLGATGYFPDPLKPVEFSENISLTANENTAFWITVYVSSTVAGAQDYDANIIINNNINIPVKLHVFDFEISEDLHIKSQMNVSHNTILSKYGVTGTNDEYWMYVDKIKQFFIDHRLTPKSVLWSGGLTSGAEPYIDYDCNGNWTDNDGIWGFEAPADRYMNGTGLLNGKFSEPFNNGTGFPSFMCASMLNNDPSQEQRPNEFCGEQRNGIWSDASDSYNSKWFEYITSMQNYLNTNNLLDKAYYYFANEPQNQADYDAIAWYSQKLKEAAPNLKLMISEEPRPEIYAHPSYPNSKIDIWLPVLNNYNPEVSWDREVNHNEESWIYFLHGTTPPYYNPITIDHQGIESKFTGWFLWKYRIKGIAYYALNDWSSNPWTNPMNLGQNGNSSILYPPSENNDNISYGTNNHRFVPSIRLELLRDGIEDYEYLHTLAGGQPVINTSNDADYQANKIIGGLTSYTRNAEFMYNLRRLIGLKNGNEISTIPDIEPPAGHWRSQGAPGNYFVNFQVPNGLPSTTSNETILDVEYKFYETNDIDYLQVGTNNYDEDKGYGWYASDDVNWQMTYDQWFDNGNELQKSCIYSDWGRSATFEFDIPSGQYDVTVSIGHRGTYNNQYVTVEGVIFYENASTSDGCLVTTLPVSVNDNKLTMEIGNNSDYTILNYITIIANGNNLVEEVNYNEYNLCSSPNPFNDYTSISFDIPETSEVKLSIINLEGKEIYVLKNCKMEKGEYNIDFNPNKTYSNGIYFCKLEINGKATIIKIIKK